MPFRSDLTFGRTWEETASQLVGGTVEFAPSGRFKEWDFTSDGVPYEVKADRLAYKYGCKTMFIEYECNGVPSGISTTKAKYYVYFMVRPNGTYTAYKLPVTDLRMACFGCPVKKGGDGYRSRGYIVPVEGFRMSELKQEREDQELLPSDDLNTPDLPSSLPLPHDPRMLGSKTSLLPPLPAVLLG